MVNHRRESSEKELAETIEGDSRNWRGIAIAVLVIIVLSSIIGVAVFLLSPELREIGKETKKEKLVLEDVIHGIFSPRGFNGTWISDFELLYTDQEGNLLLLNMNSPQAEPRIFVKKSILQPYIMQKYSLSPNREYLLITYDIKKVFRHTYYAHHKILRISNEEVISVGPNPNKQDTELEYVSWGSSGSQLVFVHRKSLYYQPNATATPILVASSPSPSTYNVGIPDWLYEEEILSSNNAVWWSPKGSKICYATFNDSTVDSMQYQIFGSYEDGTNLYPRMAEVRYPKPGRPNPESRLWIYDPRNPGSSMLVSPPPEIGNSDHYFTNVHWVDEERIAITWLRRIQNYSVVSICSVNKAYFPVEWRCVKSIEISSKTGWVEPYDTPFFADDKKHYFLLLPSTVGFKEGSYRHIAKVSVATGDIEFLTSGLYDTVEILSLDPASHKLYYIATLPKKAGERHLFQIDVDTKETKCFTCQSNECLYNRAVFSTKAKYFALECWGPGIPKTDLRLSNTNELHTVFQTNEFIREKLPSKILPKIRSFSVLLESGFNASVKLYIPPSIRDDEVTKYPLLINVYGGPGSQQVSEKFSINWGTYLAVRKNIVYGFIDGRGSGFRGEKLLHTLYRRLGTVEVEDQIATTRFILDKFPFIDKKRVGIWGWSYGGYVTAMALSSENSVFTCGISVAPVSSWLYYDSAYTERYMGLPTADDNYVNYRNADVFQRAVNFKSKKFLLVHGTADDNVHFQQAMMLTKALTRVGIIFQQLVYPDENHALNGVTKHLYQTMEAFLSDSFKLDSVFDDVGLKRRRVLSQG